MAMLRNLQLGGKSRKRPTLSSLATEPSPLQASTHAVSPQETVSPSASPNASLLSPEQHVHEPTIEFSPPLTPLHSGSPSRPSTPVVSQNNDDIASNPLGESDGRELIELIENKKRFDKTARGELVHIVHSHFDGPYICWTGVAVETLNEWWKMFKIKCRWDEGKFSDEDVFKAFKKEGSTHLRKTFETARRNKKKPVWIKEKIWTAMLAIWEKEEFKHKSEVNKRNRSVATDMGIPPYRGGSISTTVHKKQLMDEKRGTEPSPKEIFQRCYQKKDGTGLLDPSAQKLVDNYDIEIEKETQAAEDIEGPTVIDKNQCWINATGGVKKGRIMGMGSEAPSMLKRARHMCDSTPLTACGASDASGSVKKDMMAAISGMSQHLSQEIASLASKVTNVQKSQDDMRRDMTALGETVQMNKENAREESSNLEKYVDKTIDGAVIAMRLDNDEMKSGLQKSMIELIQNYFSNLPSS